LGIPRPLLQSRPLHFYRIRRFFASANAFFHPPLGSINGVATPPTPSISPSPPAMSEKERTKVEEANSDHATEESGGEIDEKRLLRKLDWHLLPLVTVLFLLSFLDRSNGNPLSLPLFTCLLLTFYQLEMLVSKGSPRI